MKISDAYPSKYLKASDLNGKNVRVIIDKIDIEEVGDDQKLVVYFQGKEKGLVLNKTNANNIGVFYGDETNDWIGHPIELFMAMVDFQGRTVEAIRVKVPKLQRAAPVRQQATAENNELNPPPADDVSF